MKVNHHANATYFDDMRANHGLQPTVGAPLIRRRARIERCAPPAAEAER
jgi:hypothetical protein